MRINEQPTIPPSVEPDKDTAHEMASVMDKSYKKKFFGLIKPSQQKIDEGVRAAERHVKEQGVTIFLEDLPKPVDGLAQRVMGYNCAEDETARIESASIIEDSGPNHDIQYIVRGTMSGTRESSHPREMTVAVTLAKFSIPTSCDIQSCTVKGGKGVELQETGFAGVEWTDNQKMTMAEMVRDVRDIILGHRRDLSRQSLANNESFVKNSLDSLLRFMKGNSRMLELYNDFQQLMITLSFKDDRKLVGPDYRDEELFRKMTEKNEALLGWTQKLYDLILLTPSSGGKRMPHFGYMRNPVFKS